MMSSEGTAPGGRPTNVRVTTTTTTTTAQPAPTLDWIKFDINYFMTIPGILKLAQFFFGILCMALAAPTHYGGTQFFLFVVVLTFIITILWIFIYFCSIRENLTLKIPWIVLEFYYTAGATLFYFIATIIQFSTGVRVAAGIFGLFNTIAYGVGSFILYKEYKENENPNQPSVA